MIAEVAYRFIQALGALEQDGEIEPIVATFAETCEIETPIIPQRLHGKIEARAFWAGYRMAFRNIHSTFRNIHSTFRNIHSTFRNIHSTFRNIVIGENSIALEWTASCTNRSGKEFKYNGVSILDISGPRITHLRSYFDSRSTHEQISIVPAVQ